MCIMFDASINIEVKASIVIPSNHIEVYGIAAFNNLAIEVYDCHKPTYWCQATKIHNSARWVDWFCVF